VINEAPTRVDVWFTQEMFRREGANTLSVFGSDGAAVHVGEAELDDDGRVHLSIELAANLEPGEYEVRWTTLSAVDGDAAEGSFTFTYDPDATPSTATPAVEEPAIVEETPATTPTADRPTSSLLDEGGSFPWWAAVGALVVVLTGGLGAWALMAGQRGDEGTSK
jgi:methionine-rich copper-binding protein CopC